MKKQRSPSVNKEHQRSPSVNKELQGFTMVYQGTPKIARDDQDHNGSTANTRQHWRIPGIIMNDQESPLMAKEHHGAPRMNRDDHR